MTVISIPKVTITRSPEELYKFLSNVQNFKLLMPSQLETFEVVSDTDFNFTLKGMPKISLSLHQGSAPSLLILNSIDGKTDFSLKISANRPKAADSCEVEFNFQGNLNPMLSMMVKKPLTNLLQHMAARLQEIY